MKVSLGRFVVVYLFSTATIRPILAFIVRLQTARQPVSIDAVQTHAFGALVSVELYNTETDNINMTVPNVIRISVITKVKEIIYPKELCQMECDTLLQIYVRSSYHVLM